MAPWDPPLDPPLQAIKNSSPVTPLQPWSWPSRVFERIHIDFALGPFQGSKFLIVVTHSKWPEAIVMKSTTVEHNCVY